MLLVAARREMVERVLAALRSAGLKPEGVDLSAFATVRALHRAGPDDELVLYLAIGGLTNLAVARGTECTFARASGSGVEALAVELAERAALTLEHAYGWLAHVGVQEPVEDITGDAQIIEHARQILLDGVRRIASEVRSSLDFHRMQEDAGTVSRAVMTGPASAIPGFDVALASELGIPVEQGLVDGAPAGIDAGRVDRRRRPGAHGGPGMKAVNLIPVEDRRGLRGGGSGSGVASYIVLGVLAVVVAMSAAYTLTNRSLSTRHAELDSLQSQVETAQAQVQRYAQLHRLHRPAPEAHRDRPQPRGQPLRLEPRAARARAHDPVQRVADLAEGHRRARASPSTAAAPIRCAPRCRTRRSRSSAARPARPTSPRSCRACAAWTASSA